MRIANISSPPRRPGEPDSSDDRGDRYPDNRNRPAKNDAGAKFASYELHDVQEYWILDPQKQAHRFYRRAGDMLEEFAASDAKIASSSIRGFWVKRAWLDPVSPPKVGACLKEILRAAKKHL